MNCGITEIAEFRKEPKGVCGREAWMSRDIWEGCSKSEARNGRERGAVGITPDTKRTAVEAASLVPESLFSRADM
jgi:hypothetical protein